LIADWALLLVVLVVVLRFLLLFVTRPRGPTPPPTPVRVKVCGVWQADQPVLERLAEFHRPGRAKVVRLRVTADVAADLTPEDGARDRRHKVTLGYEPLAGPA
jgi:hypothetical protein